MVLICEDTTEDGVTNLHQAIQSKNVKKVEILLMDTYADKHAMNTQNESAVCVSLKSKQFKVYELLTKNKFTLGPTEYFGDVIHGFSDEEKEKLREIHIDCVRNPSEDFLDNILMKCKLDHTSTDKDRESFSKLVPEVFKKLAAIQWIALIMRFVSFSDALEIVFDFKRNSVDHIDPTMGARTEGICYQDYGHIFIGAKRLLDENLDGVCYAMSDSSRNLSLRYAVVV